MTTTIGRPSRVREREVYPARVDRVNWRGAGPLFVNPRHQAYAEISIGLMPPVLFGLIYLFWGDPSLQKASHGQSEEAIDATVILTTVGALLGLVVFAALLTWIGARELRDDNGRR